MKLSEHVYQWFRLLIIGLGFGLINLSKDPNFAKGWMAGYTLCWIFSYINLILKNKYCEVSK